MDNMLIAFLPYWNAFRSFLFEESGAIMTIISFLTGITAYFSFNKRSMRKWAVLALVVTILLGINYIDYRHIHPRKEMYNVPNVTGLSYSNAQLVIRTCGFSDKLMSSASDTVSVIDNPLIIKQDPPSGTKAERGSDITISTEESGVPENHDSTFHRNPALSLRIIDGSVFKDGYHFEFPDPQNPETTCLIDFKTGFSGIYEYSRPLTETEQTQWFHGGKLYDADGSEIGSEGCYPSFWSNPEGMFAVEFPEGLPAGTYTYELYQSIDGQKVSDTIDIVVP